MLHLWDNNIGPEGALGLAAGLVNNTGLRVLDLRANRVGDEGTVVLAAALRMNHAVARVSLMGNGIRAVGGAAIGGLLGTASCTLRILDLRSNRLGDTGAAAIAEGLEANANLCRLWLRHNHIRSARVLPPLPLTA